MCFGSWGRFQRQAYCSRNTLFSAKFILKTDDLNVIKSSIKCHRKSILLYHSVRPFLIISEVLLLSCFLLHRQISQQCVLFVDFNLEFIWNLDNLWHHGAADGIDAIENLSFLKHMCCVSLCNEPICFYFSFAVCVDNCFHLFFLSHLRFLNRMVKWWCDYIL